jgi:primosomal protein N' (replication factor Y)
MNPSQERPQESAPELWKVAVDAPLPTTLTYRAPFELRERLHRGQSVMVPLGKGRKVPGVLIRKSDQDTGEFKLKDISGVDEAKPLLHEPYLKWLEWLSRYYVHPIGHVVEMTFPPLPKQEKARKSKKAPVTKAQQVDTRPSLTAEQAKVIAAWLCSSPCSWSDWLR